ncbi:ABC transporter ATP-binding protein [Natronospirillum operosum]|uniref:Spermidine/putrescine import ATP-binding protein PotA n=1 Tax=Natronospirillum operosum TaxID=2759953 RepID=A0A4Z0WGX2_9GAMM|nr:ABC transporter ATP-binding protein [Natronospirillum operosum]TGG94008.1 ABC transporter ATP-binding protein [Natronospirillum operosum]
MEHVDTANPYVVFDRVQKTYDGEELVVKDLNLSIEKGEFLTMLGPSGSGKTTCLMMLAGFETSTFGEIRIDGVAINNIPPHKRGIGMVFQNYALFPHMTIGENLAFPLEVRQMGKSEREEKIRRALAMVQMEAFANRRPAQLSGGQQQRVALARALVFEPELVLMDEPLGALDKNLRETMQYEIKHLHEQLGVTVVYVTHDQTEALTMSDRIAVFNDGRIQQLAAPADLYERPENAFVAAFIGENNRMTGAVEEYSEDKVSVRLEDGSLVQAKNVCASGQGDQTTLSLRPERAFTIGNGDSQPVNCFDGKVEELIYLGDHIRARMNICGHDDFIIKLPNASSKLTLKVGQPVKVGWAAEDCRALDLSEDGPVHSD